MRTGRRKDLYRKERDSLEGPHEEPEIQRKALRRGKNLGEERLPEERWRRMDVSGSLREGRSEEMTQSNTSSREGRKYLLSPRGGDGN